MTRNLKKKELLDKKHIFFIFNISERVLLLAQNNSVLW